jgi:hypothetical protein
MNPLAAGKENTTETQEYSSSRRLSREENEGKKRGKPSEKPDRISERIFLKNKKIKIV